MIQSKFSREITSGTFWHYPGQVGVGVNSRRYWNTILLLTLSLLLMISCGTRLGHPLAVAKAALIAAILSAMCEPLDSGLHILDSSLTRISAINL